MSTYYRIKFKVESLTKRLVHCAILVSSGVVTKSCTVNSYAQYGFFS